MSAPAVLAVTPLEVLVESRTQPGIAWRVKRAVNGPVLGPCACPARKPLCAHVVAAQRALEDLLPFGGPRGCDDEDVFANPWSNRVGAS